MVFGFWCGPRHVPDGSNSVWGNRITFWHNFGERTLRHIVIKRTFPMVAFESFSKVLTCALGRFRTALPWIPSSLNPPLSISSSAPTFASDISESMFDLDASATAADFFAVSFFVASVCFFVMSVTWSRSAPEGRFCTNRFFFMLSSSNFLLRSFFQVGLVLELAVRVLEGDRDAKVAGGHDGWVAVADHLRLI